MTLATSGSGNVVWHTQPGVVYQLLEDGDSHLLVWGMQGSTNYPHSLRRITSGQPPCSAPPGSTTQAAGAQPSQGQVGYSATHGFCIMPPQCMHTAGLRLCPRQRLLLIGPCWHGLFTKESWGSPARRHQKAASMQGSCTLEMPPGLPTAVATTRLHL